MANIFSKYYQKTRSERLAILAAEQLIDEKTEHILATNQVLTEDIANNLIENQIGQFPLPIGLAPNFLIDQQPVVVPLVVEEPSVVAACSNGAKTIALNGGFTTNVKNRGLIGQIIMTDLVDIEAATATIQVRTPEIIAQAKKVHPSIFARGGGVTAVETRVISNESQQPEFLTIHLIVDVKDAMGANIVNTILEGVQPLIETWIGGEALMTILSNYNDNALVTARCTIHPVSLETKTMSGEDIAKKIVTATRYAHLDPYRAATHNKGIMNGIDSVLIATGNDPRAVAAGAHAYAARDGQYRSMSHWTLDEAGNLQGELTLPMPVGIVGGAISVLPLAKSNLAMMNCDSASDLARIIVAVGLAQNFSALRALVTEGIQKGHMGLHANSLAIHVGATGSEIEQVAAQLKAAPKMSSSLALDILNNLRKH